MTPLWVSVAAALASLALIGTVLWLIRQRKLKERYALLWLLTGAVLLVLSVWRGGLNTIAGWLGITGYPPAILFAVAILFVILVLLHYSTVLSKLDDEKTALRCQLAMPRRSQGPCSPHCDVGRNGAKRNWRCVSMAWRGPQQSCKGRGRQASDG